MVKSLRFSLNYLSTRKRAQLQPPISLLEFQPLAAYCNNILNAFNDLRLCAPLSLACNVVEQIESSLKHAVNVILQYHRYVLLKYV